MRPKEINQLIQEQTESFFEEEGFKYSKKDMGYKKQFNNSQIDYGFFYVERHPQYYYEITLLVQLKSVEEIYSKIRDYKNLGNTYVFPLSYFLDRTNYINKNPEFLIEKETDIPGFSQALTENYKKYIKDFIPEITQPQNMLSFLLGEIATGGRYANDERVFIRTLILMKILGYGGISQKLAEFKEKLSQYSEDLKEQYYKQMDDAVNGNY